MTLVVLVLIVRYVRVLSSTGTSRAAEERQPRIRSA